MSKSNTFENDCLKLWFNASPIAGLADNAAAAPLTNLYVALHTADPGEAGAQTATECTYAGYARAPVPRTAGAWTVTGSQVVPAANIDFPAATGGSETATHFSIGTAATGAGKVLYKGPITPTIAIATGVTPRLTTGTNVNED